MQSSASASSSRAPTPRAGAVEPAALHRRSSADAVPPEVTTASGSDMPRGGGHLARQRSARHVEVEVSRRSDSAGAADQHPGAEGLVERRSSMLLGEERRPAPGLMQALTPAAAHHPLKEIGRMSSVEERLMQRVDWVGTQASCVLFFLLVVGVLWLAEERIFQGRHFAHLLRAPPPDDA
mmetsp:Transcript_11398/g.28784  ORF Transcript_11398/g.28784 Transcript_11398/m.28784 type:complete len:180 (+) Transcript_11398:127-666(+)|eukprot:jgi/Tetstr1/437457/TSEL_026136.t1